MKRNIILFILTCALVTALSGCGNTDSDRVNIEPENEVVETQTEIEEDENIDIDLQVETEIAIEPESGYEEIDAKVVETVVLGDNEEIESMEWVLKGNCFRVRIQYIDTPDNEYSHKRDYFFYINRESGEREIIPLEVTYPSKSEQGADRYVYDACDFDACLQDINFDGRNDIVISLGNVTTQGVMVHCAYFNEGDCFLYNKTFEEIPNYVLDRDNELIEGSYSSGSEHIRSIYKYDASAKAFVTCEPVYDNWVSAYSTFLSDKSNFYKWLSKGNSIHEMACQPLFITGFTILDLDADNIPELVVLAQNGDEYYYGYYDQKLIIYSYDDVLGDVRQITEVTSEGSGKNTNAGPISFLYDTYDCIAGIDTDGALIVFNEWGDICSGWDVRKVNIHETGGDRFEIIYEEYYDNLVDINDTEFIVEGDAVEATRILNDYTPIMFFDITDENIRNYIVSDYKNLGLLNYSREEVVDFLKNKVDAYHSFDKSGLQIDGEIDSTIKYNYEYLMQWDVR